MPSQRPKCPVPTRERSAEVSIRASCVTVRPALIDRWIGIRAQRLGLSTQAPRVKVPLRSPKPRQSRPTLAPNRTHVRSRVRSLLLVSIHFTFQIFLLCIRQTPANASRVCGESGDGGRVDVVESYPATYRISYSFQLHEARQPSRSTPIARMSCPLPCATLRSTSGPRLVQSPHRNLHTRAPASPSLPIPTHLHPHLVPDPTALVSPPTAVLKLPALAPAIHSPRPESKLRTERPHRANERVRSHLDAVPPRRLVSSALFCGASFFRAFTLHSARDASNERMSARPRIDPANAAYHAHCHDAPPFERTNCTDDRTNRGQPAFGAARRGRFGERVSIPTQLKSVASETLTSPPSFLLAFFSDSHGAAPTRPTNKPTAPYPRSVDSRRAATRPESAAKSLVAQERRA
ncbi:hypothetical protein B0H12DRAFT_1228743 [Mycena haematopus]|nr:hypothetical protein B0H12DRAFT_1228743 [Mycena haematopus]